MTYILMLQSIQNEKIIWRGGAVKSERISVRLI